MNVYTVPVKGYFDENCFFYVCRNSGYGVVIDPGAQPEKLLEIIRKRKWKIRKILLTHGHFDHTGAVEELRCALNIPVFAHEKAPILLEDGRMNLSSFCIGERTITGVSPLREGDRITLPEEPELDLQVIHTPGHTPDSVTFYSGRDHIAFVGDTIFRGSIGNYQYPGSDRVEIIRSIREKILTLPEETVLYSGHTEETTVGTERKRYL